MNRFCARAQSSTEGNWPRAMLLSGLENEVLAQFEVVERINIDPIATVEVSEVGGTSWTYVRARSAPYCVAYQKGFTLRKDKNKQVTWNDAVNLVSAPLSAQSSWISSSNLVVIK